MSRVVRRSLVVAVLALVALPLTAIGSSAQEIPDDLVIRVGRTWSARAPARRRSPWIASATPTKPAHFTAVLELRRPGQPDGRGTRASRSTNGALGRQRPQRRRWRVHFTETATGGASSTVVDLRLRLRPGRGPARRTQIEQAGCAATAGAGVGPVHVDYPGDDEVVRAGVDGDRSQHVHRHAATAAAGRAGGRAARLHRLGPRRTRTVGSTRRPRGRRGGTRGPELSDDQELFRETTARFIDARLPDRAGARARRRPGRARSGAARARPGSSVGSPCSCPRSTAAARCRDRRCATRSSWPKSAAGSCSRDPSSPPTWSRSRWRATGAPSSSRRTSPTLATGERTASWAFTDRSGVPEVGARCAPTASGAGYTLDGTAALVPEGPSADFFLVSASDDRRW